MSKRSMHISKFFITINTNQVDVNLKPVLRKAYMAFYEHIEDFIIHRNPFTSHKIDHIEGEASTEIGTRYGRVHLHAFITITHNSNIQLNEALMRKYFKNKLGLDKNLHINIKYVPDTTWNLQLYIKKYQSNKNNDEDNFKMDGRDFT